MNVIDPAVRKDQIAMIVRWGNILKKYNAGFIVIEAGGIKRTGYDFAAHRANIVGALNEYGKALADIGVGSGLHQHTGTAIETRDEVYAVMESVDTRVFKFAPDVGQLQKGGADAAKIVKDFASITVHMHLKDFVNGPHMGGYSPLGLGRVDLKSILETMEQANPKANIMHELDGSRNMPYTPRQTAEISKWYLQKLGYTFTS
jgi:inosose dehydratase